MTHIISPSENDKQPYCPAKSRIATYYIMKCVVIVNNNDLCVTQIISPSENVKQPYCPAKSRIATYSIMKCVVIVNNNNLCVTQIIYLLQKMASNHIVLRNLVLQHTL